MKHRITNRTNTPQEVLRAGVVLQPGDSIEVEVPDPAPAPEPDSKAEAAVEAPPAKGSRK
jgi:hypothetical protein